MANNKNKNIQTLSDLIRYGKTASFSLPLVSYLTKNEDIVFMDELAYNKYRNILLDQSIWITLTTKEYNLYRLNPKKLSIDLYATPNLDHLILWLNNTSEFEFDKYNIRLIPRYALNTVFKQILAHEEQNIKNINTFSKG